MTEGQTTEVVVDNAPIRGRIQITPKAADYNDITKDKKGALLEDAVFEIVNNQNEVIDRIETDNRGVATSKLLPLGVYNIREITAPKHYILNDTVFYAEVTQPYIICTVNGDLPNEYRFTNRSDAGGQREDEWAIAKDAWVTLIYASPTSKGKLPNTGY